MATSAMPACLETSISRAWASASSRWAFSLAAICSCSSAVRSWTRRSRVPLASSSSAWVRWRATVAPIMSARALRLSFSASVQARPRERSLRSNRPHQVPSTRTGARTRDWIPRGSSSRRTSRGSSAQGPAITPERGASPSRSRSPPSSREVVPVPGTGASGSSATQQQRWSSRNRPSGSWARRNRSVRAARVDWPSRASTAPITGSQSSANRKSWAARRTPSRMRSRWNRVLVIRLKESARLSTSSPLRIAARAERSPPDTRRSTDCSAWMGLTRCRA